MTADTLDEAIDMVNDIEYGLTSGLHSLDRGEMNRWLTRVQAGNLYINRGITGAIVRRQSFGGWKRSAIGAGTKAGGPSYLYGLGDWVDAPVHSSDAPRAPRHIAAGLLNAAEESGVAGEDLDWLRAALGTDADAWDAEFGVAEPSHNSVLNETCCAICRCPSRSVSQKTQHLRTPFAQLRLRSRQKVVHSYPPRLRSHSPSSMH